MGAGLLPRYVLVSSFSGGFSPLLISVFFFVASLAGFSAHTRLSGVTYFLALPAF